MVFSASAKTPHSEDAFPSPSTEWSTNSMAKEPNYDGPLPQCEGPKLNPNPHCKSKVDFIRLLSDSESTGSTESGGHAHVFEVSIGGETYALKVFKFFDDEEVRAGLEYTLADHSHISIDLLHAHSDPFYNECRAFGQIIQAGQNGGIAVRCYGHLTLPAEIERDLNQRYKLAWDRPADDYDEPLFQRQPFRAIVKELIKDDVPLSQKDMNKMVKDLKEIRALGVYPMDLCRRNYRAGLLVDMSLAMTEPHYLFGLRSKYHVADMKREDLVNILQIAKDGGFTCRMRDDKFCSKLRPRGGKKISYR